MADARRRSNSSDLSFNPRHGRSREASSINHKRDKSKHRASVACAACREKRIRCVVPKGRSECVQCQRIGNGCIIKNDDERRRPISRAYMNSLAQRVAQLEHLLKEQGTEPPPIAYPPKTTRGSLYMDGDSPPKPQVPATPGASFNVCAPCHPTSSEGTLYKHPLGLPLVSRIVSSPSIDSQELDNPTGSSHDPAREHVSLARMADVLHSQSPASDHSRLGVGGRTRSTAFDADEQTRRGEHVIRSLPRGTHDYLLQLFWQHYNAVLHVVHEKAFTEDLEQGKSQFYSVFLHLCILAMGIRFADKARDDIKQIFLPGRESTCHRAAKYMLDQELESPGGIPSIAALLILGDCEVGVGRENTGWMYSGMAIRLAFEKGLHLDVRHASSSVREIEVRRSTVWACVIYDRYWSVFLGRPTSMKARDLEVYALTNRFERLGTCRPAGEGRDLHTRIYEALLDLMDIAGRIIDSRPCVQPDIEHSGHPEMILLDRELRGWAYKLPQSLQYTEENRVDAPYSFYFLHQQYHSLLIHLHRPFTGQERPRNTDHRQLDSVHRHNIEASRSICTESAVAVALVFSHHRQQFDGRRIFSAAVHHAGCAATALVAALASRPSSPDNTANMQCVGVLQAALRDISQAYAPAQRMANMLEAAVSELKRKRISPDKTSVPHYPPSAARKNSRTLEHHIDRQDLKWRQTTHRRNNSRKQPNTTSHSSVTRESNLDTPPGPPSTGGLTMVPPQSQEEPTMWCAAMESTPPFQPQRSMPTPLRPQDTPTLSHNPAFNVSYWAQAPTPHILEIYPPQPVPPISNGMPVAIDGEMATFNFLLPSEDDWARWHAGSGGGDIADDLDGFPPRSRLQEGEGGLPVGDIVKG